MSDKLPLPEPRYGDCDVVKDDEMGGAYTADQMHAYAAAARAQALEEAAKAVSVILDMEEEARAYQATHEQKGTDDELPRLRHWATVSTFNAGVRRCVAAVRALKDNP